ncbi:MAG: transcription-repair coupling factor [Chloroflexota bacterium]
MLNDLLNALRHHPYMYDLFSAIQTGQTDEGHLRLGLSRATRLPVLSILHSELKQPILLLTDRTDHALSLADELKILSPDAPRLLFPEPAPLFYEKENWGPTTRRDRLLVLATLIKYSLNENDPNKQPLDSPIIIAPARAVMTRTLPTQDYMQHTFTLRSGQVFSLEELVRKSIKLGYQRVSIVIAPSQFSRRGGLLDLWPPAESAPVRLEFFGDEIETLRRFDPETQRTSTHLDELLVTPGREFILPDASPQSLDEITEFDIPLFHPTSVGLLDFLPPNTLVLIDDILALEETISEFERQALDLRTGYIADELIPSDFPIPYLTLDHIRDSLPPGRTIELGPATHTPDIPLTQAFTHNPRFGGHLKSFIKHLVQTSRNREPSFIVSRQSARIKDLWKETAPDSLEERSSTSFIQGSLSDGWTLTRPEAPPIHLFTDGEIFGWHRPQPRHRHRPVSKAPEADYADLTPGDWVVHIDHGIGKFQSLVQRAIDGPEREYLCVEYAEGDQLFVPVYQADRLTRYIGPDSNPPTISRLGSQSWQTTKSQVQKAVEGVAEELLELYAKRLITTGHAFAEDTAWQEELESSFPYIETEDQLIAIREVKQDMEVPRPMDRLICGDVGYGKTEVALRAAFKAIMDGKQVVILVPTTVLAQQHYHTFLERLATFPVEVEMLSRFRTPKEQQDILERLGKGSIDIIIGTHRLLSEDVLFKDLGLLIIDEEQRFGVTHKEMLKRYRTEVDVLTLTATPIPRTLYMALTGARDISTINTPPEERLTIVTHVGPYDPQLIRRAILRELDRGGQVFFVHNRVQTIRAMYNHLKKLLPQARIAIGHGQMPENELSQVMMRFRAKKVDVLLTTSIIESGLDIPNANTLIVDRADTFGLAQLYQLRGRVGRGAQRAYAYFFRHKRKSPTSTGRQRLETIAEYTELGSGFNIAMRDLEIRGAGELLGIRQHGHIAAVGFHLYTRLLAEAVQRLRADRGESLPYKTTPELSSILQTIELPSVNVDLPLPISLPVDYISDREVRLGLYRRIAEIRELNTVDEFAAELNDRFGPPPEAVHNLLYQLKVKILAQQAGLATISGENGKIVLRYPSLPEEKSRNLLPIGDDVSVGKNAYRLLRENNPRWPERLLEVLTKLSQSPQSPDNF